VCHYCASDVFTRRYRDDVKVSENVSVVLGATAVALETGGTGTRVDGVRAARFDGQGLRVRARVVVLAGGGVENTRLLLASELGTGAPLVGRFVMDHPEFRLGVVEPQDPDAFREMAFYDLRWVNGAMVSGLLTLREDVKRAEGLKNLCCMVVAKSKGAGSRTELAMKAAAVNIRRPGRRGTALRDAARALARLDEAAAVARARTVGRDREYTEFNAGWSRAPEAEKRFRVFELIAATEQSPDADNRLVPTGRRDRFGLPVLELQWQWREPDKQSVLRTRALIADELAEAGLGRFRPWVPLDGAMRPTFPGLHHPMGPTRMDPDPSAGVVDEQCRVHGVDNLFVAGSSVFPTGLGYANPTLTLVALATRLADHLETSVV
jgi:choline dehydrogenase-like flavoprotein